MSKSTVYNKKSDQVIAVLIDNVEYFGGFKCHYRAISKLMTLYVQECIKNGSDILITDEEISNISGAIELLQQLDDIII